MNFLVRNIKWGRRGGVADETQKLPTNYLVKNAISQSEAKSSAWLHFDAEVVDAEVVFVSDPYKVDTEVIVDNG